jgi:hypothetical protein
MMPPQSTDTNQIHDGRTDEEWAQHQGVYLTIYNI